MSHKIWVYTVIIPGNKLCQLHTPDNPLEDNKIYECKESFGLSNTFIPAFGLDICIIGKPTPQKVFP
jgi:hypothetical protein